MYVKPTKILNEPVHWSQETVTRICAERKARFVADTEHGGHRVSVFYDLDDKGFPSRYFGVIDSNSGIRAVAALAGADVGRQAALIDGSFMESQEITGAVADSGEVVYSRHRHDFRWSPDKSVAVDGGRDYLRTTGVRARDGRIVTLRAVDGELTIIKDDQNDK